MKKSVPVVEDRGKVSFDVQPNSILDNIYYLEVDADRDIQKLLDSLNSLPQVLYAEPLYREGLLETPNDPEAQPGKSQYYLSTVQAYEAWELTKSSPDIVIGVVDTGTDLDHEDLEGKLYKNENDPVNGVDDDNNGYIDDYHGYDFADNDPNPEADGSQHGTHVSGIAAAETNNALGMASLGYSARLSPLKAFKTDLTQAFGNYRAIIYAADNGYDIINLSWGGVHRFSQFQQDIINYAVLEKNVVVVAAAGNTPGDLAFYPASYDNVLSVAASNGSDEKAGFSSYNQNVDLVAPGSAIYSTQNNNTYGTDNGTSHAAPMVAGVAALVIDRFPDLNAVQVMERIKATTDDIYHIEANKALQGKLGTGRLNAYRAVAQQNVHSIRYGDVSFSSPGTDLLYPGDTVDISFRCSNVLNPIVDLKISLGSNSHFFKLLEKETSTGLLKTNDSKIFTFSGIISKETPANSVIELSVLAQAANQLHRTNILSFETAPPFVRHNNRSIDYAVNSNGIIGRSSEQSGTIDFNGQNQEISIQSGLVLTSEKTGLDFNLPVSWKSSERTAGFTKITDVRPFSHAEFYKGTVSHYTSNDSSLAIQRKSFLLNDTSSTVLFTHEIINNSQDTIINLIAAEFLDPDVYDAALNKGRKSDHNTFIIAHDSKGFAGARMITSDSISIVPFDIGLADSAGTSVDKSVIETLINKEEMDSIGYGSALDVGLLMKIMIDTLPPAGIVEYGFLLGSEEDEQRLINELDILDSLYKNVRNLKEIDTTYYSCEGGNVVLSVRNQDSIIFFADALGQDTLHIGNALNAGPIQNDSIIYFRNIDTDIQEPIKAIRIVLLEKIADFKMERDTLVFNPQKVNKLQFFDRSIDPTSLIWDFGNGLKAMDIDDPVVSYSTTGIYTITLAVETRAGCIDTAQQQLVVVLQPEPPSISQQIICADQQWNFTYPDTLKVYATQNDNSLISSGLSINIPNINRDSVIYVSRVENKLESSKIPVSLTIENPNFSTTVKRELNNPVASAVSLFFENQNLNVREWSIDEVTINNTDTITIEATAGQIPFTARVTTNNECLYDISDTLTFESGKSVDLRSKQYFCDSSAVTIGSPVEFYAFYADTTEESLLLKGPELVLNNLPDSSRIFVRNITNFTAGERSAVDIIKESLDIKIQANPDTLYLENGFSVKFKYSPAVQTTLWYLDDVYQTMTASPTFFFDSAGVYPIELLAISENGCEYIAQMSYTVMENLPLSVNHYPREVDIYPNPSTGIFSLKGIKNFPVHINITDLHGRLMRDLVLTDDSYIDSKLQSGTYLLYLQDPSGKRLLEQKIIIKND